MTPPCRRPISHHPHTLLLPFILLGTWYLVSTPEEINTVWECEAISPTQQKSWNPKCQLHRKKISSPCFLFFSLQFFSERLSSVQSFSRVRLFATPWIAARQASLSITNSQSSLRLMSIKSVMPSKINFYWSIVDLQRCVSFCCTNWISYTYTYIHSLFRLCSTIGH